MGTIRNSDYPAGATFGYQIDELADGDVYVLACVSWTDRDCGPTGDRDVVEVFTGDGARARADAWVAEATAEDRELAEEAAVFAYERAVDNDRYDDDRRFA